MRRWGGWAIGLLFGAGILGACELESWLARSGVRSFRELEWDEARPWLEDPGTTVVEIGARPGSRRRIQGAVRLEALKPLPAAVIQGQGAVVVVGKDPRGTRRLAARIVRAGRRPVVVVRLSTEGPGSASLPRFARPQETDEDEGDESDGRGVRGQRPEL